MILLEKRKGRIWRRYGGSGGGGCAYFSSLFIRIEKIMHPNPNPSARFTNQVFAD